MPRFAIVRHHNRARKSTTISYAKKAESPPPITPRVQMRGTFSFLEQFILPSLLHYLTIAIYMEIVSPHSMPSKLKTVLKTHNNILRTISSSLRVRLFASFHHVDTGKYSEYITVFVEIFMQIEFIKNTKKLYTEFVPAMMPHGRLLLPHSRHIIHNPHPSGEH